MGRVVPSLSECEGFCIPAWSQTPGRVSEPYAPLGAERAPMRPGPGHGNVHPYVS